MRHYGCMLITVDNRIRIPLDAISDEQLQQLRAGFTYENPSWQKLEAMGKRCKPKNVPKHLSSWVLKGDELTLPRGGMTKVQEVLGRLRVRKRMSLGDPALAGQIPDHKLEPRGYQVALRDVCEDKGTALIRSPQGSGKTTVGYSIASALKLPTLVVVPTLNIFEQWVQGVKKNLGMDPSEVGIIQGNKRIIRPLTIGMQQTLRGCAKDYLDVFGCIIGDEAQRFAATTFFDVIDLFPAKYRIGMSADERRSDGKEFLIYDVFGEVVMEVPRDDLIAQGSIIDAEIRVIPTSFKAPWYRKLKGRQKMSSAVQDKLAQQIREDPDRNELIMQALGWCADEQQPTITMTWRREHCAMLNADSLERGWNSGLLLGTKTVGDKDEFNRTVQEMEDGELLQSVGTYQAVGVGFNLPKVSRGIFATPCAGNSGKQQFGQFCGRFERPNPESGKTDAVVYYLWDKHVHGLGHLRNIRRWKPKVTVLHDGEWVPAKQYTKEEVKREEDDQEEEDAQLGFKSVR